MESFFLWIHDYLVAGALEKGGSWGGNECRAQVSERTHALELSWIVVGIVVFHYLDMMNIYRLLVQRSHKMLIKHQFNSFGLYFDKFLALIHFSMYVMLIYWKSNIKALANLTQPCHLVLLCEGIALMSSTSLGVSITVLMLPTLIGKSKYISFFIN